MKQKYWVFSATTILLWAFASGLIRLAFGSFSAVTLAAARCWLAAITLLIVCLVKKMPLPRKRDIPIFLVAGATGFSIYTVFFNLGFALVTTATGNVVLAAAPIFSALIARIFLKEQIRPLGWVFTGVSFVGILILLLWNGVLSINSGVLFLLVAAVLLSIYNLIQRRLTQRYTAIQSSAYSMIAGAILVSPLLPSVVSDFVVADPTAIAVVVYLGAFGSGIAFLSWSKAFSLAKRTADVSNFMYLTPFVSAIVAFAIFSELPDWGTVIGGAVILIGLWMFQKSA
ncbi:MAG: DMT family transporter [Oscillospiraceae bacterium]|jgi:drug/metabolite transporter (DMT)-like permease|nr:DMT family transporter [Oscillospiraceae bacterium]